MSVSRNIYRSSAHIKRDRGRKPHEIIDGIEKKHCNHCETWKELESFTKHKNAWDGLNWYCRECTTKDGKRWRDKNPVYHKNPQRVEYFKRYYSSEERKKKVSVKYKKARDIVFSAYGNICKKCGFSDLRALCLDHVNGDGKIERKSKERPYSRLLRIIKEDFPDRYQLLCANCNMIKMFENAEFPGWQSRAIGNENVET